MLSDNISIYYFLRVNKCFTKKYILIKTRHVIIVSIKDCPQSTSTKTHIPLLVPALLQMWRPVMSIWTHECLTKIAVDPLTLTFYSVNVTCTGQVTVIFAGSIIFRITVPTDIWSWIFSLSFPHSDFKTLTTQLFKYFQMCFCLEDVHQRRWKDFSLGYFRFQTCTQRGRIRSHTLYITDWFLTNVNLIHKPLWC